MFDRLKKKWGIKSNFQIIMIMVVFSLAGMAITQCRPLVFHLFGLTAETPTWIKVTTYILCVFPLYQLFLMIFGTLLGQFRFFWEKEKKMCLWIARKFSGSQGTAST